jgi:predicted neutral ceramidase superfamily lipid hydrolase
MTTNRQENYLALLAIRQAAGRRDTTLTGGMFAVFLVATIVLGLLDRINARSIYLVTALLVVLGLAYLTAWVKFQIINSSIELIENLYVTNEGQDNG